MGCEDGGVGGGGGEGGLVGEAAEEDSGGDGVGSCDRGDGAGGEAGVGGYIFRGLEGAGEVVGEVGPCPSGVVGEVFDFGGRGGWWGCGCDGGWRRGSRGSRYDGG